jgi:hypothetical protein
MLQVTKLRDRYLIITHVEEKPARAPKLREISEFWHDTSDVLLPPHTPERTSCCTRTRGARLETLEHNNDATSPPSRYHCAHQRAKCCARARRYTTQTTKRSLQHNEPDISSPLRASESVFARVLHYTTRNTGTKLLRDEMSHISLSLRASKRMRCTRTQVTRPKTVWDGVTCTTSSTSRHLAVTAHAKEKRVVCPS